MFAKGRSCRQASIDGNRDIILKLIHLMPILLEEEYTRIDKLDEEISHNVAEGDIDIYASVRGSCFSIIEDEIEMKEHFYRAMVLLISSYVETSLKGMLKKQDMVFHSNYICCAYKQIKKDWNIHLPRITKLWPKHQDFTQIRNDVAHNRRVVMINEAILFEATYGAHRLLRTIADALESMDLKKNGNDKRDRHRKCGSMIKWFKWL